MTDGTTLITGASAGIGRALAEEFASQGHALALVARREDRLQSLADELGTDHGVETTVVPMDLADDDAPAELFAALAERGITLDGLVNNVGIGVYGRFAEGDMAYQRPQLRLNVEVLAVHRR